MAFSFIYSLSLSVEVDTFDLINFFVHSVLAVIMFADLLLVGHPVRMDPDLYFSSTSIINIFPRVGCFSNPFSNVILCISTLFHSHYSWIGIGIFNFFVSILLVRWNRPSKRHRHLSFSELGEAWKDDCSLRWCNILCCYCSYFMLLRMQDTIPYS